MKSVIQAYELRLTLGCIPYTLQSCLYEILVQHVEGILLHLVMAFNDQASSHTRHVTNNIHQSLTSLGSSIACHKNFVSPGYEILTMYNSVPGHTFMQLILHASEFGLPNSTHKQVGPVQSSKQTDSQKRTFYYVLPRKSFM